MHTTTIEQRKQLDYERFETNRRFEEMTDIAERLSYPIDTTIHYEVRNEALYAMTDSVERPFHNQTFQAMHAGEHQYTGDQSFQRVRLRLEHEEALLSDNLGAGNLDGNVLVKYSKVPDAIVEGRTSINGYRRDLLRSFVRIYYKTENGVSCRLFTLDHNHPAGVQRVGELLGIDTNQSSEEVLAAHTLFDVSADPEYFAEQLMVKAINLYDTAIREDTGEQTYAGSHYLNQQDAMGAISAQSHLMSKHMDAISAIMSRGLGEDVLEQERKKTAAAIKLATEGHDISSSSDSSVMAEVADGDYGRDCPTANGMNQAAQTMENKWSPGECRVCFAKTMVGSCAVCEACAEADNRGIDLLELREKNIRAKESQRKLANRAIQYESYPQKQKQTRQQALESQFGEQIEVQTIKTVGGAYKVAVSKRTKKVVARL